MHLLYLDESGHPDDPNSEFFVVAGFSVFERQTHWLERRLDAIAGRFTACDGNAVELHGSEMYGGKNLWREIAPEARSQAVVDTLSLLSDRRLRLRVFASVIEKSQMKSENILRQSFENVAASFDSYLCSMYRRRDPQRGLIIFDKCNYEQQLQALSQVFKHDGHQSGKLRNFAEVPLFLDSKASRLIQMADIVAYWIFRYFQSSDFRGFHLIKPFCADCGNTTVGLIADLSTETTARLANAAPHKHPFPFPAATVRPTSIAPAGHGRDACRYQPGPRTQSSCKATLR